MSMHDIEDFAEGAVMFVHGLHIPNDEKIELIHSIYTFHDMWDTSFTKLRVYDILVSTTYFRLFYPWDNEAAEPYTELFNRLKDKGSDFEFVYKNPSEKWNAEANPVVFYFLEKIDGTTPACFCCDAGQPLWPVLTGKEPPNDLGNDLFIKLAQYADEYADIGMKAELFYIALGYVLLELTEEQSEALKGLLFVPQAMPLVNRYHGYRIDPDEEFTPEDCCDDWLRFFLEHRNDS